MTKISHAPCGVRIAVYEIFVLKENGVWVGGGYARSPREMTFRMPVGRSAEQQGKS